MERLDMYDVNGNLTGRTIVRGEEQLPGEYHLAASAWIVRRDGWVLLQRRSMEKLRDPGKWNVTGGAVLSGESSRAGCVREVLEEIGLEVQEDELIFLLRTAGKELLFDDYVIFRDFDIAEAKLQAEEVSELCWMTMDEVRALYASGEMMFDSIEEFDLIEEVIRLSLPA